MSRKNRKSQMRKPVAADVPSASAVEGAGSAIRPRTTAGFNPDYSHIRKDLKRIGLLAAFFILAMIVGSILSR